MGEVWEMGEDRTWMILRLINVDFGDDGDNGIDGDGDNNSNDKE